MKFNFSKKCSAAMLAASFVIVSAINFAFAGPVDSSKLKNTVITAVAETKIPGGTNMIFCSTFQMAWSCLADDIVKGAIELAGAPGYVETLNSFTSQKSLVKPASCVFMAGFGKTGIIERINKSLAEKFGPKAPKVTEALKPEDVIAYAYLFKELKFVKDFEALKDPVDFGNIKLDAFGIRFFNPASETHRELSRQVDILYYGKDGFIIRFNSSSPDEEIILSTIAPDESLAATFKTVAQKIAGSEARKLGADDRLRIPKIGFDLIHSYAGLIGKNLLNKGFEKYIIAKALQAIKFSFNEKGATLTSEARIKMTKTAMPGPSESKDLTARPPFIIYLKEKAAQSPYFMMNIADEELLVKK